MGGRLLEAAPIWQLFVNLASNGHKTATFAGSCRHWVIDKPPPTATIAARFSENHAKPRLPNCVKAPGFPTNLARDERESAAFNHESLE